MAINIQKLQHASEFDALCDDAKTRVREVSCDDVALMLSSDADFTLVDVRDRDEFDSYHVDGAVFLSKGWVEAKIHTIVPDKGSRIVLYCGGGNRSVLAADNLQRMGYSDVVSMAGGIKAWVNSGKAVVEG
jgi:rhodanese-related sulfurtransferase